MTKQMLFSALILSSATQSALTIDKETEHQKLLNAAFLQTVFTGHKKNEIKQLLKNGADINAKDILDETVLHKAALFGRLKKVKLYIENGVDINAKDLWGQTALHKTDNPEVALELIKNGIDIEAQNNWGYTAAHKAAKECNCEMLQILNDNHANLTKTDGLWGYFGNNPLDLARSRYANEQYDLNKAQEKYDILECNEKDALCSELQQDILRKQKVTRRCQDTVTLLEKLQNAQ